MVFNLNPLSAMDEATMDGLNSEAGTGATSNAYSVQPNVVTFAEDTNLPPEPASTAGGTTVVSGMTSRASSSNTSIRKRAQKRLNQWRASFGKNSQKLMQVAEQKRQELESAAQPFVEETKRHLAVAGRISAEKSREITEAAKNAASKAAKETHRTVKQIGSHPIEKDDYGGHKVKGETSDIYVTYFHAAGIFTLATGAFLASFYLLLFVDGKLINYASFFGCIVSPLVFWQKAELEHLAYMRRQQNKLRNMVTDVGLDNKRLQASEKNLKARAAELKYVEDKLDKVAGRAGVEVDRLVQIVHENSQYQEKIKEHLRAEILLQIASAILTADDQMSKKEVRQLEYRLKNIPGVIFYHDRFQKLVTSEELSSKDVIALARNLQDPKLPESERVFVFKLKEIANKQKVVK